MLLYEWHLLPERVQSMGHQKCINTGLVYDDEAENWVGIQVAIRFRRYWAPETGGISRAERHQGKFKCHVLSSITAELRALVAFCQSPLERSVRNFLEREMQATKFTVIVEVEVLSLDVAPGLLNEVAAIMSNENRTLYASNKSIGGSLLKEDGDFVKWATKGERVDF